MTSKFSSRTTHALLMGTAIAAFTIPSSAFAQDTADQPSATQATTSDEGTNEIIITAQRRAERLEDVPMTVGVANAATIEATNATSLRDINRLMSGVMLNQGGAFPAPTIRGVTSLANGTSFENNVAIYIDGFYQTAAQGTNIDLPSVNDIQVLKGPQGTLYGRNATGGAILINTVTPGDEWRGKAELTYAKYDDWRIGGYFAGPITDGIGVSIAAYTRRSDGYMKLTSRTVPGETEGHGAPLEQDSIRAKLKFDLTDTFSATFGYNYTHVSDARGNMFSVFENVSPLLNVSTRPTKLGTVAFNYGDIIETRAHEGTMMLSWDTGIGELKSYTGYTSFKPITSFDFDGTYQDFGGITNAWSTSEFKQKTFQQSIDYAISAIDHVDLVVGGNYFKDKLKTTGPHIANYFGLVGGPWPEPPPFSNLVQNEDREFRQTKEAWAVYVDATWHVNDQLHINIGGRYSHESQDVFAQSRCFITPVTSATNVCNFLTPVNGDRFIFPPTNKSSSYSKFTPRASIRYEIEPAPMSMLPILRASAAVPGTRRFLSYRDSLAGLWPAVRSTGWTRSRKSVDAFEIGFKTARRNFRFELAAFLYKYKDLQVSVTVLAGTPPVTQTVVSNAPKADVKGLEASAEYSPIENLNLRGNFTWLHARYGDGFLFNFTGVDATGNVPGSPTVGGIGINTNPDPLKTYINITQLQDLSGEPMARSPNFAANLGFTYDIPMGDGGIKISGNAFYTSKYVVTNPSVWGTDPSVPADRQDEQRFVQGGYFLLSGSIQYTLPNGHLYMRSGATT
jgi:iron complex outermembrane receptor protein